MAKVLQPFAVVTTFFSYEENVSLSCVLPVLHGVQEGLKKNDHAVVVKFKEVGLIASSLRACLWPF